MPAAVKPIRREPPIGGWNTRDIEDDIPLRDARTLDNFIPAIGGLRGRKGCIQHCDCSSITTDPIKTLVQYESASETKMIAAAGGFVIDVSTTTPIQLGSGYSSDEWQTVNFEGKLIMVNGKDNPIIYDGFTLSDLSITSDDTIRAGITKVVKVVDPTQFIGVHVFKHRVFYWQKNTQDVWYTELLAPGGNIARFPLSRLQAAGGHLVAMSTISRDGGSGPDDLAVFVMSSGAAIVYQGTGPGAGEDWAIVGVFRELGRPFSPRGIIQNAGDLQIMTEFDFLSLEKTISAGGQANVADTKISGAITGVKAYRDFFGWEQIVYPDEKLIIYNIPQPDGEFHQYVYSTVMGAWTRFKGWNAYTFCVFNDELYFGVTGGIVYHAYVGYSDDESAIQLVAETAWDNFGSLTNKSMSMIRDLIKTEGGQAPTMSLGAAKDFEAFESLSNPATIGSTAAAWGSDWGTPWTSAPTIYAAWDGISSYGNVHSIKRIINTESRIEWLASYYLVENTVAML